MTKTFEIKKTTKRWEEEHAKWRKRAESMQQRLKKFPQPALKQALGERFDEIMDLRMVKIALPKRDRSDSIEETDQSSKRVDMTSYR